MGAESVNEQPMRTKITRTAPPWLLVSASREDSCSSYARNLCRARCDLADSRQYAPFRVLDGSYECPPGPSSGHKWLGRRPPTGCPRRRSGRLGATADCTRCALGRCAPRTLGQVASKPAALARGSYLTVNALGATCTSSPSTSGGTSQRASISLPDLSGSLGTQTIMPSMIGPPAGPSSL